MLTMGAFSEVVKLNTHLRLPLIGPIGSRRTPAVFVMESTHAWHLYLSFAKTPSGAK